MVSSKLGGNSARWIPSRGHARARNVQLESVNRSRSKGPDTVHARELATIQLILEREHYPYPILAIILAVFCSELVGPRAYRASATRSTANNLKKIIYPPFLPQLFNFLDSFSQKCEIFIFSMQVSSRSVNYLVVYR